MVYQERLFFPNLSVAANIFAGHELTDRFGRLDEGTMRRRAAALSGQRPRSPSRSQGEPRWSRK
jgi:ABC-type sugar transport system ATPase subunit